jgi:hypothetical protein
MAGGLARRTDRERSDRQDHVDVEPGELGGQLREGVETSARRSHLEHDVPTLDVAL